MKKRNIGFAADLERLLMKVTDADIDRIGERLPLLESNELPTKDVCPLNLRIMITGLSLFAAEHSSTLNAEGNPIIDLEKLTPHEKRRYTYFVNRSFEEFLNAYSPDMSVRRGWQIVRTYEQPVH